jgi:hypothetical protein
MLTNAAAAEEAATAELEDAPAAAEGEIEEEEETAEGEEAPAAAAAGGQRQPIRYCFLDAETSQDQPLQLRTQVAQKHIPVLIIAEVLCEKCIAAGIGAADEDVGRRAEGCVCGCPTGPQGRRWCSPPFLNAAGDNTPPPANAPHYNPRRLYFHAFDDAAADPVGQLLDYLTRHGPHGTQTIVLAHNGGKYDYHLLLEAMHQRNEPPRNLCTTGLKIYSMRLRGRNRRQVAFKDSLNYFFCELDALPKAFGLPADRVSNKPFFPYMFIRRQNLHDRLVGLPAVEHYQPQWMKPAKREEFLRWHATELARPNCQFQLREQLILYCMCVCLQPFLSIFLSRNSHLGANDVAILRESAVRFRQLIAANTQQLDPFLAASTGAGLAMATLRRCF